MLRFVKARRGCPSTIIVLIWYDKLSYTSYVSLLVPFLSFGEGFLKSRTACVVVPEAGKIAL